MNNEHDALIRAGRAFTREFDKYGFESDQEKGLPQPPLVKAPVSDERIKLPMDFDALKLKGDLLSLLRSRASHRVFTDEAISLSELSFLLWATQGIKEIRGNNYATLRTVPSGGARHGFETYLAVIRVEGLKPGRYHYLPMTAELEYLGELNEPDRTVTESLMWQDWAGNAAVAFYWSLVQYRCEWRYDVSAHRVALIDSGYVSENLYLACESLGLGTCAIAAFDYEFAGKLFDLDNDGESIVLTSPVGRVKQRDRKKELDFYAFVNDEPGAQG